MGLTNTASQKEGEEEEEGARRGRTGDGARAQLQGKSALETGKRDSCQLEV